MEAILLRILLTLSAAFYQGQLYGFVVLSGPDEATLAESPDSPVATFYWDGSAPRLKDVDQLEGGKWVGLDDSGVMEQIILLAFEKWNQIPGSWLQMQLNLDPTVSLNADDEKHSIVVKAEQNLTTAAFALPVISEKRIIDCDISVSSKETSAKSLAYTMIHEVGHCVGLGHAHTNYGAIMGYARTPGSLELGADDIAGIIYLYTDPSYDDGRKEFLACATLGTRGKPDFNGTSTASILLVFIFPLIFASILISLNRREKVRLKPGA